MKTKTKVYLFQVKGKDMEAIETKLMSVSLALTGYGVEWKVVWTIMENSYLLQVLAPENPIHTLRNFLYTVGEIEFLNMIEL